MEPFPGWRMQWTALIAGTVSAVVMLSFFGFQYIERGSAQALAPQEPLYCSEIVTQAYVDANLSGQRDRGEVGVDIHVTAVAPDEAQIGNANTGSLGATTLGGSGTQPVRVEFAEPTGDMASAPLGAESTGRVSFPRPSSSCRADYAVYLPLETSSDEAQVSALAHPQVDTASENAGIGLDLVVLPDEQRLLAARLPSIEIGDRLWSDLNGDGRQDPDEPGLADVQVHLFDLWDRPVASTVTNANGSYTFDSLLPHSRYRIRVELSSLPDGTALSPAGQGSEGTDSDALMVAGQVQVAIVTGWVGVSHHDFDIGFVPAQPT